MGFGTLFFGYFLLLNITYFSFTDLISALIMAMGLYKLSEVSPQFKNGFYSSVAFALIGGVELVCSFVSMFSPTASAVNTVLDYASPIRYVVITIITLFILQGIEKLADEVGLAELSKKAHVQIYASMLVYAVMAILSVPIKNSNETVTLALAIASVITMLAVFIVVGTSLVTIYRAYMKICMPDDVDNDTADTPSRFEFINKHREHTEAKQREYAEYRLEKFKKKNSKKKKK